MKIEFEKNYPIRQIPSGSKAPQGPNNLGNSGPVPPAGSAAPQGRNDLNTSGNSGATNAGAIGGSGNGSIDVSQVILPEFTVEKALANYNTVKDIEPGRQLLVEHKNTKERFLAKIVQFPPKDVQKDDKKGLASVRRGEVMQAFLSFAHPNIVRCRKTFVGLDQMVMILDCCNGNLQMLMDAKKAQGGLFSNDDVYKAIVEYGRGIKVIHDRKIMHRDIQPKNLLIGADGVYKLADFKNCVEEQDSTGTVIGEPIYTAPEVLHENPYTVIIDVYSFGVVLHEMIMLLNPFSEVRKNKIHTSLNRVLEWNPNPLVSPAHNPALLELVKAMMAKDPVRRPSINEVLQKDFIVDYIRRTGL